MPRPQFTLCTLLVAMLVVAAFFAGTVAQRQLDRPSIARVRPCGMGAMVQETLITADGKQWFRTVWDEDGADVYHPQQDER